ncbi:MAG: hypothetical protein IIB33_01020, partial [Chloroflexi bacterium]|nr:hypothetical protein [Chloroflexota bacterium]
MSRALKTPDSSRGFCRSTGLCNGARDAGAWRLLTVQGLQVVGVFEVEGVKPGVEGAPLQELAGGNPAVANMSSRLLEARLAETRRNIPLLQSAEKSMPGAIRAGMLQVIIGCTDVNDEVLEAIRAQNLTIVRTYPEYNVVVVR